MPLVTRVSGQASLFVGTTTPTATQTGDLWQDTNTSPAILKEWNGSTWEPKLTGSTPNTAVMAQDTTIGDYTQPSAATASSAATAAFAENYNYLTQAIADAFWVSTGTGTLRVNITNNNMDVSCPSTVQTKRITYDLGAGAVSDSAFEVRFKLVVASFGADGSGANHRVFFGLSSAAADSSGNQDSILLRASVSDGNIYSLIDTDGSAPDNAASDGNFAHGLANETLYVKIARTSTIAYTISLYSDATYTTLIEAKTGVVAATTAGLRYFTVMATVNGGAGAGSFVSTIDNIISISGIAIASTNFIYDGDITTAWTSNSEINPNNYVDMGSSLNLCALALYVDAVGTTATQVKIQTSTTASSWTDVRLINTSALIAAQWNYIRFNIILGRYVRIYGNDGTAKVLSLYEARVYTQTDAQVALGSGRLRISATDATLDLDGT